MSSNNSLAVWCVPLSGQTGIKFEVHFNYWRMSDRPQKKGRLRKKSVPGDSDLAEIGIMVEDISLVEKFNIYIPAKLNSSAIQDCSPHFAANDVIQGIFNEVLTAHSSQSGPLAIKRANGRIFCRMHRFSANAANSGISGTELFVGPFGVGTICTIQSVALRACQGSSGTSRAYFRLRIAMPASGDGNPFVEDVRVHGGFVMSDYSQIEYLDFRLNEARSLPTAVENRMASDQPAGTTAITLVAFLTAVPVSAELSVANTEFHKMRLLEYPIWSNYAPGLPKGMVVYHWKRVAKPKKSITDFSAFVKLQMRRNGRETLVKYLLFAFLFGVFGNLAAGWLQPHVDDRLKALWACICGLSAYLIVLGKSAVTQSLTVWRRWF